MAKQAAVDITIGGIDDASKETENLKKKLRELKNQLLSLDEGSAEFKKMSQEAGALEDKIGDVNARIKVLASDTGKLDAVLGIGEGIAGGFAAAQGAVGLFAEENEELNKILLRVQSSMALLNGLQAVANTLNKDSAARIAVTTAAQKAYAIAVGQSTGAMKGFRLALISTGIGALIAGVGLLIANFDKVKEVIFNLVPPLKELGKIVTWVSDLFTSTAEKTQKAFEKEADALDKKIAIQKAKGKDTVKLEIELANKRILSYKVGSDEYIQAVQEREVLIAQVEKDAYEKRAKVREANEKNRIAAIKDDGTRQKAELKRQYDADLLAAIANGQETKNITKKYYQDVAKIDRDRNKARNDAAKAAALEQANILKEAQKNIALLQKDDRGRELLQLQYDIQGRLDKVKSGSEQEKAILEEYNLRKSELRDKWMLEDQAKHDAQWDKDMAAAKERADKEIAVAKNIRDAKVEIAQGTASALGAIAELAASKTGEMTELSKALALAQVAIDTGIALSGAVASANSPTPDNLATGGLAGIAKYVALAGTILSNIARAKRIIESGSTGPVGFSAPSIPAFNTPQPSPFIGNPGVAVPGASMQNARDPQAMRVYVTEYDISNVQDRVGGIKSKARVM